jgi:hypothetical protein
MSMASRTDGRRGVRLSGGLDDPVFLYSETPGYLMEMSRENWESLDAKPEFVTVAGTVTQEFKISCDTWEVPLADVLPDHQQMLERIIWREEVSQ